VGVGGRLSDVRKRDLLAVIILAFNFLVSAPAAKYPLWTVHSVLFRSGLVAAFWVGMISAVGLPIWIGIRFSRESEGRGLKIVEFMGALCWILALGYLVVSEFPIL